MMFKGIKARKILGIFSVLLIFGGGLAGGYFYAQKINSPTKEEAFSFKENTYSPFLSEVYDKIKENYWKSLSDEELTHLFVLGIEKLVGQPQSLKKENKEELLKTADTILKEIDSQEKKKEFVAQLADIVLANLEPFGRSRLYSKKDETALKNNVENKNPSVDQYEILGVLENDSQEKIKEAYRVKEQELVVEAKTSTEAAQKLSQIENSFRVLGDEESRQLYDTTGVEPTITYRLLRSNIFYLYFSKISPTTFDELQRVTKKVDSGEDLDTLILDLRGNIGGSIDILPYLLGPFIGEDSYAYQFFHQGERTDFKTRVGWLPSLVRYKRVVVLIDKETQSSAEVIAATLKKYNVGVLVGVTTRGWGTIERVFKLDSQFDDKEEYSMFLVHSLTLRDDGQPIEGQGVEPTVNINNLGWENELYKYFRCEELTEVVKELI
ncbi:hypothetical protein COT63_00855 [Candidatus Shapirobacteria bacterium CG09_land_8_20_14_0_10_38_17]|uniref:J domain-containing protein n=1 Tax=Candidatus Shapirobacteria bacterium CG09_land_8_20_14_0_10_38_17 TaxID=1974884 RepID=A0A2H0WRI7_9BACT|nr:MAG: hypothetical protein COT63_00855 [Candidatus Shapirobacteria bacterium CG09_land_8_20_14_0_10_38_17]